KNDMISYDKLENVEDEVTKKKTKKMVPYEKLFRGDNNPRENRFEVEDIAFKSANRQMPAISPLKNIIKYNVDVLGNKYPIKKEKFNPYLDEQSERKENLLKGLQTI
ncbi:hypothetical protein, partial [Carnobacterium sp.]|uniref:hypothetical protein n=1 Tax=Carnobacterium sp. TaxID=48221 RepID=UPI0028AB5816